MILLSVLFAFTFAHDSPLETIKVVDTVDTGILRFLVKGPCTSDILTEFAVLAEAVARYSKATGTANTYPQDFVTGHAGAGNPTGTGATPGSAGYGSDITGGLDDGIRLNHLTVAVECCDGELEGGIEAGFGFYPCHDRMVPFHDHGDLPSTPELYHMTGESMGWITATPSQ